MTDKAEEKREIRPQVCDTGSLEEWHPEAVDFICAVKAGEVVVTFQQLDRRFVCPGNGIDFASCFVAVDLAVTSPSWSFLRISTNS